MHRNPCLTGSAITSAKSITLPSTTTPREHTYFVTLVDYSKGYRDLVHVSAESEEELLTDPRVVAYEGPAVPVYSFGETTHDLVLYVGVRL